MSLSGNLSEQQQRDIASVLKVFAATLSLHRISPSSTPSPSPHAARVSTCSAGCKEQKRSDSLQPAGQVLRVIKASGDGDGVERPPQNPSRGSSSKRSAQRSEGDRDVKGLSLAVFARDGAQAEPVAARPEGIAQLRFRCPYCKQYLSLDTKVQIQHLCKHIKQGRYNMATQSPELDDYLEYIFFYCGECDEEYHLPEETEDCPICGGELDQLDC